ncbi:hypothetical protein SNE25_20915 [Mucilaginibacter sabulilitoris]|uniref:YtxH domain-containing protein n=1 Tax=Mucilaginibacter sabulilitoris TaxID=1173583 RepID=A0ABZ0TFQ0_9SPHI|nr:hypothetical protein [Mucilaginibacter sabulilitoris]WPU91782.1 hypothetical protein SNE25_20915 [Mucilaginibacter sabulilitoris]
MPEPTNNPSKLVKLFGDLVGLFDTKPRAAATVGMLLAIIYLFIQNQKLVQARIDDKDQMYREIITEVRKQYDPVLRDMKNAQDSNKVKIDSTTSSIKPVLETVKKTINEIRKNH